MKGWVVEALGEPEDVLLWCDDLPAPRPQSGQVIVRVVTAACNFPDILLCRGTYQDKPVPPFVPGLEVAGEVVAVGPGVAAEVGDRVIGTPPVGAGGYAELAVLDEHSMVSWPTGMTAAQAASYFVSFQTALCALEHRGNLQPGETLLVHAAAGGVGSAAVQLGDAFGARVIATAGGGAKLDMATRLGARAIIDYRSADIAAEIKRHTAGSGADVVLDSVGGPVMDASRRSVSFEGRILIVGFAGGEISSIPASHVLLKNYSLVGVHWGLYRQRDPGLVSQWQNHLDSLWHKGQIMPLVDLELPATDAIAALRRLEQRENVGKIVLRWS